MIRRPELYQVGHTVYLLLCTGVSDMIFLKEDWARTHILRKGSIFTALGRMCEAPIEFLQHMYSYQPSPPLHNLRVISDGV